MLAWWLAEETGSSPPTTGPLSWDQAWAELQPVLGMAGVVAAVWGMVAVILFGQLEWRWRRVWPRQRFYATSWGIFHVAVWMLFAAVFSQAIMSLVAWPKSWAMVGHALATAVGAMVYICAPLWVLEVPPYQVGWNFGRWREDIILGWMVWIPAVVVTCGAWLVAACGWPSTEHPLIQEFREARTAPNLIAFVVTTVVLAPLAEETLFRGLILRKMAAEPIWADLTMLLALIGAVVQGYGAKTWGPILFLVSVGPGYLAYEWLTWRLLPRPGLGRAVYASSLLFAALHADVWPAPIPLFFLSLFLGTVAARTQSLLGPILMHAAFNLTSVLALLLE